MSGFLFVDDVKHLSLVEKKEKGIKVYLKFYLETFL
jgi:hypothetical protein